MPNPNVIILGGGTGTSTVLEALKPYDLNLSAVVSTLDNGGSTGLLRQQYPGLIGIGDVRQCMRTLAQNRELAAQLDQRLPDGHAKGNLELVNRSLEHGGVHQIENAIDELSQELDLKGQVIPATLDNSHLRLAFPGSQAVVTGELEVAQYKGDIRGKLGALSLLPQAKLNPRAEEAIANADIKVIAPGNFYGSIIAPLLIDGMCEAINHNGSPLVMIGNLQDNANTRRFLPGDYTSELNRHTGLTPDIFISHQDYDETDLGEPKIITADLRSNQRIVHDPHDKISSTRSTMRHCGQTLGALIIYELEAAIR